MHIDEKLFKKLERLSQIELDESKKELVKQKFSQMLDFISSLDEISEKLDKVSLKTELKTPLREDEPFKSEVIKCVLEHAPSEEDGFFIVPKIIENAG